MKKAGTIVDLLEKLDLLNSSALLQTLLASMDPDPPKHNDSTQTAEPDVESQREGLAESTAPIDRCSKLLRGHRDRYHTAILRAFKRKPLTRYEIYTEFVKHYVRREALKQQASLGGASADEIIRDAPKLAQALAIEMTMQSLPKVTYEPHSKLAAIAADNPWDKFLAPDDPTLAAVRAAAPVQVSGNVFAMVHSESG
eukprot:SAG11_NODE_1472_length_4841_cov_2.468157_2_plen_198_part_00